jgi:hypothetical protein
MYAFMLNGQPFDVLSQSASVSMAEDSHDSVTVSVSSATLTTTDNIVDMPISFRWGMPPRLETFNGYVVDVKEDTAMGSGISLSFTMTILGATKAMFVGTPHFWSHKSAPSAVKDLVSKNLLGFAGDTHTYLWEALAQTTESDWTYITALAKRIGWQIFNRYGVVMCYDPLKSFTNQGLFCRCVMSSAAASVTTDRILLDFQPAEETDMFQSNLGQEWGYFTSSGTPQIIQQPGTFSGYVFQTDVVIADQDAAKVYADAGNVDMDRWTQYALARVWGDADIYPGMCVEIVTTNKAYVKPKYDGKWFVRQTNHQMDRQSYQTMLSLARPDSLTQVMTASYSPFWLDPSCGGKSRPSLSLSNPVSASSTASTTTPPPQWVSSWADRRVQSVL